MATQGELQQLTKDDVAQVCPTPPLRIYHLRTRRPRSTDSQHNKDGDLWVIIDSIVYDLSKFAKLHPGGTGVLLDEEVGELARRLHPMELMCSGQRRDDRLFWSVSFSPSLTVGDAEHSHRSEVLQRPQYARLRIGQIKGEKERIRYKTPGDISTVRLPRRIELT